MTDRERRAANLPTLGQIRNVLRDVASDCSCLQLASLIPGPGPAEKVWHVIGYLDKLIEAEQAGTTTKK